MAKAPVIPCNALQETGGSVRAAIFKRESGAAP
jgi:hypothetical protein